MIRFISFGFALAIIGMVMSYSGEWFERPWLERLGSGLAFTGIACFIVPVVLGLLYIAIVGVTW